MKKQAVLFVLFSGFILNSSVWSQGSNSRTCGVMPFPSVGFGVSQSERDDNKLRTTITWQNGKSTSIDTAQDKVLPIFAGRPISPPSVSMHTSLTSTKSDGIEFNAVQTPNGGHLNFKLKEKEAQRAASLRFYEGHAVLNSAVLHFNYQVFSNYTSFSITKGDLVDFENALTNSQFAQAAISSFLQKLISEAPSLALPLDIANVAFTVFGNNYFDLQAFYEALGLVMPESVTICCRSGCTVWFCPPAGGPCDPLRLEGCLTVPSESVIYVEM